MTPTRESWSSRSPWLLLLGTAAVVSVTVAVSIKAGRADEPKDLTGATISDEQAKQFAQADNRF